jgi:TetR/AcrR family transcriptional regulator
MIFLTRLDNILHNKLSMPNHKEASRTRQSTLELRRAIVDAALSVFAANGFEGASTRAIAALAGVELGHMAYYFKTKETMWNEVINRFALPTHERVKLSMAQVDLSDPLSAARRVLPELLREFANDHRLTRLMLQDFSVASSRRDRVVQEVGRPIWLQLRPLFEALQKRARGNADDAKLAYFAMVGGALLFFGGGPEVKQIAGIDSSHAKVRDNFIARIIDSVLQGPRPKPTPRTRHKHRGPKKHASRRRRPVTSQ